MVVPNYKREGRLLLVRLEKNKAAREDALRSIRIRGRGLWWEVRIGGPVRGRWHMAPTRSGCVDFVKTHYDRVMMDWIRKRWAK